MNTRKPPLESTIVRKTLIKLRSRGGFWFKVHGTPMQIAGLPDIIGCYRGRFVSFEAKRDASGKPTKLQSYMMKKIRTAGGIARLIYNPDQAIESLDAIDSRLQSLRERKIPQ